MATRSGSRVIAIEEHYASPELLSIFDDVDSLQVTPHAQKLLDVDKLRIKEMDEAGIDIQVLSHVSPSIQKLDAAAAVPMARVLNDTLYEATQKNPKRLAAFATLPTADPKAAAVELERTVSELGFKGAMLHGLANGRFLDEQQFWPIFDCAQTLNVPIYLHPATPHRAVIDTYYEGHPSLIRAGWGYGVETATLGARLMIGGVFDAYPRLQVILGHLGEGLPFLLWRANAILTKEAKLKKSLRDYFCENFSITTSGNFSFPALQCCMLELGIERILFSVDWPWASNIDAVNFIENSPISRADKAKLFSRNAERLLGIGAD